MEVVVIEKFIFVPLLQILQIVYKYEWIKPLWQKENLSVLKEGKVTQIQVKYLAQVYVRKSAARSRAEPW